MRKLKQELEDARFDLNGTQRALEKARADREKAYEILSLLSILEPALVGKYKTLESGWGMRDWDLIGMRDAQRFAHLQKAHKKYAVNPVVSETKNSKKE